MHQNFTCTFELEEAVVLRYTSKIIKRKQNSSHGNKQDGKPKHDDLRGRRAARLNLNSLQHVAMHGMHGRETCMYLTKKSLKRFLLGDGVGTEGDGGAMSSTLVSHRLPL